MFLFIKNKLLTLRKNHFNRKDYKSNFLLLHCIPTFSMHPAFSNARILVALEITLNLMFICSEHLQVPKIKIILTKYFTPMMILFQTEYASSSSGIIDLGPYPDMLPLMSQQFEQFGQFFQSNHILVGCIVCYMYV